MRFIHLRPWIAAAASVAIAITLVCRLSPSKSRPDEKTVSAAEDEVYEAVVRDMITPTHGQANISQLVFGDAVLTDLTPRADIKSCKESVRKLLSLEASTPPFNSLADKIYRAFTPRDDGLLRSDTIQDFLEKSCGVGRLSTTFNTDLPRTFIAAESIHFDGWPIEKNGPPSFEQLFPGADGIISFSHVGFDSTLDEAIVSASYVCGGLCGTGWRYLLRKKSGRWEITNKLMVWMS